MIGDLRHGIRLFLRRPVLVSAAVLSLAVGIGANTAIFSVLYGAVLSPLPYRDPSRLVVIWETAPDNPERWVAPANFVDWRRDARSFDLLASFDEFAPTFATRNGPERLRAVGTSGTLFEVLGVRAALGRTLHPDDDRPGAASAAVLSHGLWTRLFGASPDVLSETIRLDAVTYAIVGVMPAGFEAPLQRDVDIWLTGDRGVPRTFPFGGDVTAVRDAHMLSVVGRLREDVTRDVAQQELSALMIRLARQFPDTNAGLGVNVQSLHDAVVGHVSGIVGQLQFAVGLMLLIACANVAHLLLGQALARQDEMATRAALGADRRRLARQLLAEALVIAAPGGVVGLLVAAWSIDALVAQAPAGLPRLQSIGLNPVVLAFTAGVTVLTACLFGLGPVWRFTHITARAGHAASRLTGSRQLRRWQQGIVAGELALTHVLLVGAGLLVVSLVASQRVPLGFAVDGRVAAELNLDPDRYLRRIGEGPDIDPTRKRQFVDRVLEIAGAGPGVHAVAASTTAPLTGAINRGVAIVGAEPKGPGLEDAADFQLVTPDYFRAVGATLVQGRAFSRADDASSPPVAIVNQAFAARHAPGASIIGQRLVFGQSTHEIVGVVNDMRYRRIEAAGDPTFFIPMTQNAERWPFLSFTVWSDADVAVAARSLRAAIGDADPNQAIIRARSYEEIVSTALAPRRFNTRLVIVFAGAALLLAAIGTYGVMAYSVSMRMRELSVRAALGATPQRLVRLVVLDSLRVVAVATVVGVAAATVAASGLRALLYEVGPHDVRVYAAVTLVLGAIALTASYVPARRLNRLNPVRALHDIA